MSGGLRFPSIDVMPQKWQEQARKQISPREPETKRKSKYNAERVTVDGIKFDSKKEARFYMLLRRRQAAGDLLRFHRQVTFDLEGGIRYICDFQVFENDSTVHYIDVKGAREGAAYAAFRMKTKQVKARYGVDIELV